MQLEKVGQLFQVLPVYFREVAKNCSRSCKSNLCSNSVLYKIFGHFDHNGRESAPLKTGSLDNVIPGF